MSKDFKDELIAKLSRKVTALERDVASSGGKWRAAALRNTVLTAERLRVELRSAERKSEKLHRECVGLRNQNASMRDVRYLYEVCKAIGVKDERPVKAGA